MLSLGRGDVGLHQEPWTDELNEIPKKTTEWVRASAGCVMALGSHPMQRYGRMYDEYVSARLGLALPWDGRTCIYCEYVPSCSMNQPAEHGVGPVTYIPPDRSEGNTTGS